MDKKNILLKYVIEITFVVFYYIISFHILCGIYKYFIKIHKKICQVNFLKFYEIFEKKI